MMENHPLLLASLFLLVLPAPLEAQSDFSYVPNEDLRSSLMQDAAVSLTRETPVRYQPKARQLFFADTIFARNSS